MSLPVCSRELKVRGLSLAICVTSVILSQLFRVCLEWPGGQRAATSSRTQTSCDKSFVLADKCSLKAICSLCGDIRCDWALDSSFQTLGRADRAAPSCCGDQAGSPEWPVSTRLLTWHDLRVRPSHVHTSVSLLKCGHTACRRLAFVLEFQRMSTVTKLAMLSSRPSVGTALSVPLS